MEDLAYRRLLDLYYLREGPLPADPAEVARLLRLREHAEEVQTVLNEFFFEADGGWRHARCDDEILRMQDRQTKAKASAEASVNARRTNVQRTLNERSTDGELPTPTPTPTPKEKTARARVPLRPDSVTEPVWQDFLAIRKAKRSPLTDTALEGIAREAAKAGMTLAEALTLCCERGWQGFNAGWIADRPRTQAAPSRYGATIAALTGRTKQPEVIDVEPALTRIAR
jgi:uncharacterized protein YdaU (DUF1376 family)